MAPEAASAPPLRRCVVCRRQGGKAGLLRVVRGADGAAADPAGRAQGRGAYVCRRPECLRDGRLTRMLAQSLRLDGGMGIGAPVLTWLHGQAEPGPGASIDAGAGR